MARRRRPGSEMCSGELRTSNTSSWLIVLLALFSPSAQAISFDALANQRVLVVGGSGRVGGSVVTQLVQHGAQVTVGGTSLDRFQKAQSRWQQLFPAYQSDLQKVQFVTLDRDDPSTLERILLSSQDREEGDIKDQVATFDLVINTAGPFQGRVTKPSLLEACVKVPRLTYLDVCDDYCTARAAQTRYNAAAQQNQVAAIISTGCWPGVSSLMARQLVDETLRSYPSLQPADLRVDFNFFTAGSGGAGVTLLVATFLILAEQALYIQQGRRKEVSPMRDYQMIDFGPMVGPRPVAPLNLLETASIHDTLGVGNTSAQFGTAPDFWNALLGVMARLPAAWLRNEAAMRALSIFSMPIVRVVDAFAGATNAMRVDVTVDPASFRDQEQESNSASTRRPPSSLRATAIYAHDDLEPCVGQCVVAFACAVLSGAVRPGVWFPEQAFPMEPSSSADMAAVLHVASVGAHTTTAQGSGLDRLTPEFVWGSPRTWAPRTSTPVSN